MKIHSMCAAESLLQKPPASLGASALERVAGMLRAGRVYRREDLARVSNAVDRHLSQLVAAGVLARLAQGLYYVPKQSAFGSLPPDEQKLVAAFLREEDFLVFSPASYNSLGLGTTQLYNSTWVYNRKRHGHFLLGNRRFDFRVKPRFPKKITPEFLLVDMVNRLDELAEDKDSVLQQVKRKLPEFDAAKLHRAVSDYGAMSTKKLFTRWLDA